MSGTGISFIKSLKVDVSTSSADKKSSITDDKEFVWSGGKAFAPTKVSESALDFPTMENMYRLNSWVRACVDKIAKRAVAVKPLVKPILKNPKDKPTDEQKLRIETIENLLAVPNKSQESLASILTGIYTDILVWDAGSMELVNGANGVEELYAVSGDSIRKNVDKKGIYKSFNDAFWQVDMGGKTVAHFAIDEMCYFMQYPRPRRVYGLSPLESLRQTVTAELYASDFNIKRFINDATPRFAMLFENLGAGQGGPALERFKEWWNKELRGEPHKPIMVGSEHGSIKFEKIGMTNEDMQFSDYSRWLLSKIMAVYHMQPFVLGVIEVNQGRLNSSQQEEQFKKDALIPLLFSFSNQFNTLAIWSNKNFGYNDIYLSWEGIDAIDRKMEAQIHEIYLRQGVFTINMVLQQLGMEPVEWGNVPYLLNQMQPISNLPNSNIPIPVNSNELLDENGKLDVKKWMSFGLMTGGIIPTGLERVEPSIINEAITKIYNNRRKQRRKYILSRL